jgi:hypothetical protein
MCRVSTTTKIDPEGDFATQNRVRVRFRHQDISGEYPMEPEASLRCNPMVVNWWEFVVDSILGVLASFRCVAA